jgi:hypothetical protein
MTYPKKVLLTVGYRDMLVYTNEGLLYARFPGIPLHARNGTDFPDEVPVLVGFSLYLTPSILPRGQQ